LATIFFQHGIICSDSLLILPSKKQIHLYNMAELTTQEKEHVQVELNKLHEAVEKTNDFSEKLELKDKIHNMQMIMNGVKPYGSIQYFCEGCGS
jgi:hypothetical protein